MEREFIDGLMVILMKVGLRQAKKKDMASLSGLIEPNIKDNGQKI